MKNISKYKITLILHSIFILLSFNNLQGVDENIISPPNIIEDEQFYNIEIKGSGFRNDLYNIQPELAIKIYELLREFEENNALKEEENEIDYPYTIQLHKSPVSVEKLSSKAWVRNTQQKLFFEVNITKNQLETLAGLISPLQRKIEYLKKRVVRERSSLNE